MSILTKQEIDRLPASTKLLVVTSLLVVKVFALTCVSILTVGSVILTWWAIRWLIAFLPWPC